MKTIKLLAVLCFILVHVNIVEAMPVQVRTNFFPLPNGTKGRDMGNGTVIGKTPNALLVSVNAHFMRHASSADVFLNGRWHPARLDRKSSVIDFGTLIVDGSFPSVVVTQLTSTEPQKGERLQIVGHQPRASWKLIRTIRNMMTGRFLTGSVNPGESGSPVYNMQGQCVGIVDAVTQDKKYTSMVLSKYIIQQLNEWGYTNLQKQSGVNKSQVTQEATKRARMAITECPCEYELTEIKSELNSIRMQLESTTVQSSNCRNGVCRIIDQAPIQPVPEISPPDNSQQMQIQIDKINAQLQQLNAVVNNQNDVIRQQTVLMQQISTQGGKPGKTGPAGPQGIQGRQGVPGVVTIRILDSGKLISEYKDVTSGSTVELDIDRFTRNLEGE